MGFSSEPEPARGVATPVLPGVRRIVADNPGPMTYHGTNTFLLDGPDGITVIDPGPDDAGHVAAIMAAAPTGIARILLTHTHADHWGGLPALRQATGAPVYAYAVSADPAFTADKLLQDGDEVAGLTAVFTPGHAADHLCFAAADGVLFTGDHVMAWSSSVVSPPKGDMQAFMDSLNRLLTRDDRTYLSGHGPLLHDPHPYVETLLRHRLAREEAIAAAVGASAAPADAHGLTIALYAKANPVLLRAAERNVLAHLLKLERDGRIRRDGDLWLAA